jgi:peptidoglycan DL-endopeptidase CwlO
MSRTAAAMPAAGKVQTDVLQRRISRLFRSKSKRRRAIGAAILTGNLAILGVVVAIIVFSSGHGTADAPLAFAANTTSTTQTANPLDQVSSANIAETVALMTNQAETTAVTNQADSESTELATPPTTSNVVEKPQVVSTANFASNKDIKTYITVPGDTITSIAARFGITSDSIRWSNNLTGDIVKSGLSLVIPPVTGIVYTVQPGDTPTTLAAKFKADQGKITAFNDAELTGLKVGERILIPDGTKAMPVVSYASRFGGTATYGGYNGYDYGYCTYWVAKLRAQAGNPVPTNLGNAATWATRAAAMGLPTGTTPRVGAAVVTKTAGAGHVAYVTAVNADGSITVSEMNHSGWNRVDTRTIPNDGYRYVY